MNPIVNLTHSSFFMGVVCYTAAWCCGTAGCRRWCFGLLAAGLAANAVSLFCRYWLAWPMLPLYQGPFFLPPAVALVSLRPIVYGSGDRNVFLFIISVLGWVAALFPNDFYLPALQFKTPLAHLFFLFGVIGKGFFVAVGVRAACYLFRGFSDSAEGSMTRQLESGVIWGFSFWTLSIFSGALWSYLGWGTPVVWDDPLMTTVMATWLFYGLFLHLRLMTFVPKKGGPVLAVIGALFVLFFTCVPDLGKFMMPRL